MLLWSNAAAFDRGPDTHAPYSFHARRQRTLLLTTAFRVSSLSCSARWKMLSYQKKCALLSRVLCTKFPKTMYSMQHPTLYWMQSVQAMQQNSACAGGHNHQRMDGVCPVL
jgi:hypothetical protein